MASFPKVSRRWIPVWQRNFNVWRKLAGPSFVGNFGEPLFYLLALGYGLGAFIGEMSDLPYVVFLASGIVCSSAMNTATFEGLYAAYTRMKVQGTWSGMISAPIDLDDVVLGEIIWMGTKSVISVSAILLVAAALGIVDQWSALWALPMAFLIGCCFGAMALVVTAVSPSYDFFLYYFTLVITPMFLLSGVFFPPEGLPQVVQMAAQFFPLTHVVDIVRPLMTERPLNNLLLHLSVPIVYGLLAYWWALVLLRRRLQS